MQQPLLLHNCHKACSNLLLPVCRKTGIEYSALLPLQKQFGLSSLVGGMLTANNSLALAANQNKVACACNTQGKVLLGLVVFCIPILTLSFRGAASPQPCVQSAETTAVLQHSEWRVPWRDHESVWPFVRSF